jgi:hypothetical protein
MAACRHGPRAQNLTRWDTAHGLSPRCPTPVRLRRAPAVCLAPFLTEGGSTVWGLRGVRDAFPRPSRAVGQSLARGWPEVHKGLASPRSCPPRQRPSCTSGTSSSIPLTPSGSLAPRDCSARSPPQEIPRYCATRDVAGPTDLQRCEPLLPPQFAPREDRCLECCCFNGLVRRFPPV